MNRNRISSTKHYRKPNSHPQFFIRRSEIAFEERTAYIESVCAALIESRFGPGRVSPVVIKLSDRAELDPAVLSDFSNDEPSGLVPGNALSPLGRKRYPVVEAAYRSAHQMGLVDVRPNTRNSDTAVSPNHGRGSP